METPSVLYIEAFLIEANSLYEKLVGEIAWDARIQARKTATFGTPYNYSGLMYPDSPMHPLLVPIVEGLKERLGFRPNNCLMNYYESGENTMGYHADSIVELAAGTGIAIVSLGAERTLIFRRDDNKEIKVPYLLRSGSLLYMPPEVQTEWQHGLRRQEGADGRISLTFREVIT